MEPFCGTNVTHLSAPISPHGARSNHHYVLCRNYCAAPDRQRNTMQRGTATNRLTLQSPVNTHTTRQGIPKGGAPTAKREKRKAPTAKEEQGKGTRITISLTVRSLCIQSTPNITRPLECMVLCRHTGDGRCGILVVVLSLPSQATVLGKSLAT